MALPEVIEIVPPAAPAPVLITVPGSRSITNRALILAALADGETSLKGALWSDDTEIMAGAKVLGPITVGRGCFIGANAVLARDLPDGEAYTPGREVAGEAAVRLPSTTGEAVFPFAYPVAYFQTTESGAGSGSAATPVCCGLPP